MGADEPPRSASGSPEPGPETAVPPHEPAGDSTLPPAAESAAPARAASEEGRGNMLPRRGRRRYGIERLLVRLIATFGIIGIGVALGAILAASKVQGWIIGLVVAAVSVILAGLLWSSRQL